MFSLEEYVTASKTGEDGRLKLVSFIDLMQDCSQLWLLSEVEFHNYFKENNITQLLVSRQFDMLRVPLYGEKLTTTTSIYECKGLYGYRNTVVYDEQNKACAVSWSMGTFVSLTSNKMTKIPQEVLNTVTIDNKVDMEYLDRKINIPNYGNIQKLDPFKVLHNDIDMNKHMNNAQYIRLAIECLPDDFETKRLRIEYKLPAKKGDTIYPILSNSNDNKKIYISLNNDTGKAYAIIEFCKLEA